MSARRAAIVATIVAIQLVSVLTVALLRERLRPPPAPGGPQSAVDGSEEGRFEAIIRHWRDRLPAEEDYRPGVYFADGPWGRRQHVGVPPAIRDLYAGPFSDPFLGRQLASEDSLRRKVAHDLFSLRRPLLFTYPGTDGNGAGGVTFTYYVVDAGEAGWEPAGK